MAISSNYSTYYSEYIIYSLYTKYHESPPTVYRWVIRKTPAKIYKCGY